METTGKRFVSCVAPSRPLTLHQYTFFADQRYARNLIELNDHFELMVICWKPGQVSPIHNHANSSCWMGVARGELLEEYARLLAGHAQCWLTTSQILPRAAPRRWQHLRAQEGATSLHTKFRHAHAMQGEQHVMQRGLVGYINDEIAVHRIRPNTDSHLVSMCAFHTCVRRFAYALSLQPPLRAADQAVSGVLPSAGEGVRGEDVRRLPLDQH